MWWSFFIIAILIVGYYLFKNRKSPEEREKLRIENEKQAMFSLEYPQAQRIINESLEIINKTKNIDTAISRFDLIKEQVQRLLEIAPQSTNLSIQLQENSISTAADIDKVKINWMQIYLKNKIESELKKSDLLSDIKLKATQLKKALGIALKSIDYLPNDESIKQIISDIEGKLSNINIQNKNIKK